MTSRENGPSVKKKDWVSMEKGRFGGGDTFSSSCKTVKSLIRTIRNCKTAAEERDLIARESAAIRAQLQKTSARNGKKRFRALSKLLYIYQLTAAHGGISVAFGQLDALKLVASSNFAEKRLGHLGLAMLLDAGQETLLLATNSFKGDLTTSVTGTSSMYGTGLTLISLASLATRPMAQELAPDILHLISIPNAYLRKKAVLAALRLVRVDSSICSGTLFAILSEKLHFLITDRNHGVLMATCALVTELGRRAIANNYTNQIEALLKYCSLFVRVLSTLLFSSSFPEYDVNGITDPFLQVSLLRVLRVLFSYSKSNSNSFLTTFEDASLCSPLDKSLSSPHHQSIREKNLDSIYEGHPFRDPIRQSPKSPGSHELKAESCQPSPGPKNKISSNQTQTQNGTTLSTPLHLCPDLAECFVSILSSPHPSSNYSALAVKYECIQAIFSIDIQEYPLLMEKAIEALGYFLTSSDSPNGRYVALNLILKSEKTKKFLTSFASFLVTSIQSCLSDADPGIVGKAIDVIFLLFFSEEKDILSFISMLLTVLKRFFSSNPEEPLKKFVMIPSIAMLPRRLLAVLDEKHSAGFLSPKVFIDYIFELLDSIRVNFDENNDDGEFLIQNMLSILSRHLQRGEIEMQKYAVHRSAFFLTRIFYSSSNIEASNGFNSISKAQDVHNDNFSSRSFDHRLEDTIQSKKHTHQLSENTNMFNANVPEDSCGVLLKRENLMLLTAVVFIIGEYGHLLNLAPFFYEGLLVDTGNIPSPTAIMSIFNDLISDGNIPYTLCVYLLLSMAKITARCTLLPESCILAFLSSNPKTAAGIEQYANEIADSEPFSHQENKKKSQAEENPSNRLHHYHWKNLLSSCSTESDLLMFAMEMSETIQRFDISQREEIFDMIPRRFITNEKKNNSHSQLFNSVTGSSIQNLLAELNFEPMTVGISSSPSTEKNNSSLNGKYFFPQRMLPERNLSPVDRSPGRTVEMDYCSFSYPLEGVVSSPSSSFSTSKSPTRSNSMTKLETDVYSDSDLKSSSNLSIENVSQRRPLSDASTINYRIPIMNALGEWLIYEKEGLLMYLAQFGFESNDNEKHLHRKGVCRLSIETSSTSKYKYTSIATEVSTLKEIRVIVEKPSCTAITGNERMLQLIRFGSTTPILALRFRLRISFKVVYDTDDNGEHTSGVQEDIVDFVSPIGN